MKKMPLSMMNYMFVGFVMGKGYNLNELKKNGDVDVISVLYREFENKVKELND